jgi:hypothetical protein
MAIQRMIQAGGVPMTSGVLAAEWQRDWAREKTVEGISKIMIDHWGSTGVCFLWEQQLLATGK